MKTADKTEEKSLFEFLMKGVLSLILIPAAMYFVFRGAFHHCFNDKIYSIVLMILNAWTLIGILICTFLLAPRHQKAHKKLWLIFFVPTIGWYLLAPAFCVLKSSIDSAMDLQNQPNTAGDYFDTVMPRKSGMNISTTSSASPLEISPHTIFYARYPLSPGTQFTIANVKVLTAEVKEVEGSILANSETYFGKEGSHNSILTHKAKNAIAAGTPIKNSDVDPPFESRLVLQPSAKR